MEQIDALQAEHRLDTPADYHFRYARVWTSLANWERSQASAVRYLELTGPRVPVGRVDRRIPPGLEARERGEAVTLRSRLEGNAWPQQGHGRRRGRRPSWHEGVWHALLCGRALAVASRGPDGAGTGGPSGRRLALVVGNDAYTELSVLRNAVNDARTVAVRWRRRASL